ncbi:MAG: acyltransferase family protein [Candidatus Cryptobacteroides sp.]
MEKRYASLDVLRGLTVAFMCIVNNPGTWSHIFSPLRHAPWNGCSPTDLVFPTFVFCMGCAMAFSFGKRNSGTAKDYLRVFKRGALIFLVGFALNLYPFFPTELHDPSASFGSNWLWWLGHKRIFGVLQRIGLSYILAGFLALWLKKPGRIMAAIGALCVTYTVILLAFGREPGAFTLEGNVSVRIDRWLVGSEHCYHGYQGTDFDPEGLLGTMTTACTCLLGYLIGSMTIRSRKRYACAGNDTAALQSDSPDRVACRTFVYGCASLAGAMVLSIAIPISKPLWSASYVFYAGGWAMIALAFLMYVIDIKGIEKPFVPFKAMGTNALMAFVVSGVLAKSWRFISFSPSEYFGANEFTSLAWAIIFTLIVFCILWVLYKKKIVIKL